jgi:hypothetical protein
LHVLHSRLLASCVSPSKHLHVFFKKKSTTSSKRNANYVIRLKFNLLRKIQRTFLSPQYAAGSSFFGLCPCFSFSLSLPAVYLKT